MLLFKITMPKYPRINVITPKNHYRVAQRAMGVLIGAADKTTSARDTNHRATLSV
jgi:hypothetical protein